MEWRTCKGFSKYEINNLGKIRDKETKEIIRQRDDHTRYVASLIGDNGRVHSQVLVHRLVAQTFMDIPPKAHVYAIDGDLRNTNVENLTIDRTKIKSCKQNAKKKSKEFVAKKYRVFNIKTNETFGTYSAIRSIQEEFHTKRGISLKETNKALKLCNSDWRIERIKSKSKKHIELVRSKVKKVVNYLDTNYSRADSNSFDCFLVDDRDKKLVQLRKELNEAMYG